MRIKIPAILAVVLLLALSGVGQTNPTPLTRLVETLFSIPSPTGYEHILVQEIKDTLPAKTMFSQDNLGSLYLAPAAGAPRMAVLTGMDEIAYVVSGITDDGYLTLHRGVRAPHALYDTYQVGHPVRIWTRKGHVDGVWALPSSHTLSRARRATLMQELTLEHAYVDIGAGSREAVELRGIAYLDPVTPAAFIHGLAGGQLSGPALGSKACAALVLDLAGKVGGTPSLAAVQFIWLAQTKLVRRTGGQTVAMGALRARKDLKAREVVVVDTFPCPDDGESVIAPGGGPVIAGGGEGSALYARILGAARAAGIPLQEAPDFASAVLSPFQGGSFDAVAVLLPVKFAATPSEVIQAHDLEALQRLLLAVTAEGGSR